MRVAIIFAASAFLAGCQASEEASGPDEYVEERLMEIWLIGRWGDDGNCAAAIHMLGDGTFENADGSTGRWTLDGNRLTMSGKAQDIEVIVSRDGENTMTLTHSDGSTGRSTRCQGPE